MRKPLVALATTTVEAPIAKVWDALVNPASIKQYMFGTNVTSEWKEGSGIVWKGEWQGKAYEDRGTILKVQPGRLLQYTHFSPLSGLPDAPEHYHTITIEFAEDRQGTRVSLSQDNNASEQARDHSQRNWETVLAGMKKLVEDR